ncbi:MAG: hypothetical protein U5K37_11555 [Natrialbaceae archaeon]|nr:hypothetical protein [Natrialbaceae archaeon]
MSHRTTLRILSRLTSPREHRTVEESPSDPEPHEDPAVCDTLAEGGYSRHDETESPFVATFEHPGSVSVSGRVNNDYSLTITVGPAQNPVYVFPTQDVSGSESPTALQQGTGDGVEVAFEIDFGGETVPVVRVSPDAADANGTGLYREYPYYVAGLPFEGSSGARYYRFSAKGSVQFASDLEAPDCGDAIDEMTRHMMESLEPNPDSTVEDVGV